MKNVIIFLSLMVLVNYICTKTQQVDWIMKKLVHRPRTSARLQLQTLCDLSNMNKFKSDELQPFMKSRVSGTPGNQEVQQHIIHQLQALNWSVETHSFLDNTPYGVKNFSNIIGTLNPSAVRRLVLACHFDSKYFDPPTVFIGATDSAVPCAMMLDLIRLLDPYLKKLKSSGRRSKTVNKVVSSGATSYSLLENLATTIKREIMKIEFGDLTLQLIFFDGEEAFISWSANDSLYGSRKLAELMEFTLHPANNLNHTTKLDGIDLFVLLDLIGAPNPHFYSFFQNTAHHFTRLVGIEKRLHNMNCLQSHNTENTYFFENSFNAGIEDDHLPFLRRGVGIVHLITSPFPTVWHTPDDNEKALDYTTIDNLNKILRVFVAEYLHLQI